MKQILMKKGGVFIDEVPIPEITSGEVLVRVHMSCLSTGTEMSGIKTSNIPLWRRALKQPEKVANVLKGVSNIGIKRTWNLIEEKTEASIPIGYSAAGVVIAVGEDVKEISVGDRVACAGAQCAFHAEIISVPQNLCVLLPKELDWKAASTVTMGSIALQGVRRANPTIGETFVVIGLGILGLLTIQILRANGCRTIGIDLNKDRILLAKELGMDVGFQSTTDDDYEQVARLTDGVGADGVIITAATKSDKVVSSAFKISRKKGRVILVGDVGLNLNREDFYSKEIDFFISSSYGPGRYDHNYEEQGLDYPVSYVRWTENRNMTEYLRLLNEKKVKVEPLISATYHIDDALQAYSSLNDNNEEEPVMILFKYPSKDENLVKTITVNPKVIPSKGKIRIAVAGAGSFARSVHLPNIVEMKDRFILHTVLTKNGYKAKEIAKQFGAINASTDFNNILSDPDIDAILISTRHDKHGKMVIAALEAGKHVLVEKPLALSMDDIDLIDNFISNTKQESLPLLLTGYNRRFSPFAKKMKDLLEDRTGPFIINYRMNAGYIPLDHWVHGKEGGGRNLGEACHIYDLFTFLTNSKVHDLSVQSITPKNKHYSRTDNFIATIRFEDGSLCSLTYSALGSNHYDKEKADLYFDGKIVLMSDYKNLDIFGTNDKPLKSSIQDKGLKSELVAFAQTINNGSNWPIPWWQQLQVARMGFEIEKKLQQ